MRQDLVQAREAAREPVARRAQVEPPHAQPLGAGEALGLGQLARQDDDALLMMMGLVMVGAVDTDDSPPRLSDVTPIARLIGEPS